MYTIGQFSKLCQVTPKALRHYEAVGLLVPARVDGDNQYRYYSHAQTEVMQTIALLKDLGMPLKSIGELLAALKRGEDPAGLLAAHRVRLLQQLDTLSDRLVRFGWWNHNKEDGQEMANKSHNIYLRELPPVPVRSLRRQLTSFPQDLPPLIREAFGDLQASGAVCAGAPIVLYYDEEFKADMVDVEAAWPVTDQKAATRTLPAVQAAGCLYVGPYDGLHEVYAAIYEWVNAQGYKIDYPTREINMNDPAVTPPEKLVTEILVPVKK